MRGADRVDAERFAFGRQRQFGALELRLAASIDAAQGKVRDCRTQDLAALEFGVEVHARSVSLWET